MSNNPLIDYPALPPFSQIQPEHVLPAVEQLVAEGDATLVHVNEDHRPEAISAAARAVLARSLIES